MPLAAADFIAGGAVPDLIASTIWLAMILLGQFRSGSRKGSSGVIVGREDYNRRVCDSIVCFSGPS
jgi:hypothetical protein